MRAQELINRLEKKGFTITLNDTRDRIKVSFPGGDPPECSKIYLTELKEHKQEVITYLKGLPFNNLFQKCVTELSKLLGASDDLNSFLESNYPDLLAKIDEIEDELNSVWQKGIEGTGTVEQYREVLKRYYKLNEKAIQLFKQFTSKR